jgi:hypothetical protein
MVIGTSYAVARRLKATQSLNDPFRTRTNRQRDASRRISGNFNYVRGFPIADPFVLPPCGSERSMTMDKKIAGLLGAVGALASLDTAQATIATDSTTMLKAQSYADLLNSIPNAAAILKAADEAGDTSGVQVAENAHHHHHHSYRRERKIIIAPRRHHHHHHHHHHHSMKIER